LGLPDFRSAPLLDVHESRISGAAVAAWPED